VIDTRGQPRDVKQTLVFELAGRSGRQGE